MEEIEEIRKIQNKLYEESSEISNKIQKLEDILIFSQTGYKKITNSQLILLHIQLRTMKTYFEVLRARIEDLQNEIDRLENDGND